MRPENLCSSRTSLRSIRPPCLNQVILLTELGPRHYGTVMYDQGMYRMWYQGTPKDWDEWNMETICYAESDNGIDWRKPNLGLVDSAGQGKDNNLLNISGHNMTIFIYPDAPPSHRYVLRISRIKIHFPPSGFRCLSFIRA